MLDMYIQLVYGLRYTFADLVLVLVCVNRGPVLSDLVIVVAPDRIGRTEHGGRGGASGVGSAMDARSWVPECGVEQMSKAKSSRGAVCVDAVIKNQGP